MTNNLDITKEMLENSRRLLIESKKYISRVNSIGAQKLSEDIVEFLAKMSKEYDNTK